METRRGIAELAAQMVKELEVGRVVHGYLLPSLTIDSFDETRGERVWENVGDVLAPFVNSSVWVLVIPGTEPEASQESPPGAIDQQHAPDPFNHS